MILLGQSVSIYVWNFLVAQNKNRRFARRSSCDQPKFADDRIVRDTNLERFSTAHVHVGLFFCRRFCSSKLHVDEYGFIHELKSEGLQLHQAARQLLRHYNTSTVEHEAHARRWREVVEQMDSGGDVNKRVSWIKIIYWIIVVLVHSWCVSRSWRCCVVAASHRSFVVKSGKTSFTKRSRTFAAVEANTTTRTCWAVYTTQG